MSTSTPDPDLTAHAASAPTDDEAQPAVEQLVGEWLSVPEVADRLGVRQADVRRMIEDRFLVALRVGPNRAVMVPAAFFDEDGPLPALPGTFTVLTDGGMDDEELLRWLFTPDPTLPVTGHAVDAIRAGFKTEVRRRAMESAF